MDQPGLLGAGDPLEFDACFLLQSVHQDLAVFCLPGGAGGHGPEGIQLQLLHLVPEGAEGYYGPVHGLRGQLTGEEYLMTEAYRDPLVRKRFELGWAGELGGKEPNGVGPGIHATHTVGKSLRCHGVSVPPHTEEDRTCEGVQVTVPHPRESFDAGSQAIPGGDSEEEVLKDRVLDGHLRFPQQEVVRAHLVPGEPIPDLCMSCPQKDAGFSQQGPGQGLPIPQENASVSQAQIEPAGPAGGRKLDPFQETEPSPSNSQLLPEDKAAPPAEMNAPFFGYLGRLEHDGSRS